MTRLELWAGPECTVNRVGDDFRDQLEETGFASRPDDLDRLASLGATCVRFPLLWERAAHGPGDGHDWQWSDRCLARLRELGLHCIAGLVHHGSGPRGTDLLAPGFPAGLAAHARAVATRYPYLDRYTPVNEPLTTARFSALYGLWYPHRRDDRSFVRALLNQVHGTVLAMKEIRAIQPAARLVQTDDLGHTQAVARLQYQADFENERRWLSFDLLSGRVDGGHPLWRYLLEHGAGEAELEALAASPCPPDLIGVNHYITSERFLDDRLDAYPPHLHGGNGRDRYADVEAVRVCGALPGGFGPRVREAWERYGLPVAITEVHLGCSREEQMRWLAQAWAAALEIREAGVDLRAVTAWAAFGSVDWSSLLTRRAGHYEPGLWDVRSDPPRPTALVALAQGLARGERPSHPVLDCAGWWQRETRHAYPLHGEAVSLPARARPLLIADSRSAIGRALAEACHRRGLPYEVLAGGRELEDPDAVRTALDRCQPWAVIDAGDAGMVTSGSPGGLRARLRRRAALAQACASQALKLVSYSSPLVFHGEPEGGRVESRAPLLNSMRARVQALAERAAHPAHGAALLVRSGLLMDPRNPGDFVAQGLARLREGRPWPASTHRRASLSDASDLASASLDLLIDGESGIWHLVHPGTFSRFDLARHAARLAGEDEAGVVPATVPMPEGDWTLDSERGRIMPGAAEALVRHVARVLPLLPARRSGAVQFA